MYSINIADADMYMYSKTTAAIVAIVDILGMYCSPSCSVRRELPAEKELESGVTGAILELCTRELQVISED